MHGDTMKFVVTSVWKVVRYRPHLRALLVTGCEETKTNSPNDKFLFIFYLFSLAIRKNTVYKLM